LADSLSFTLVRFRFSRFFLWRHKADRAFREETSLAVSVEHPSFEEWWEPFTLGVGPAGSYTRSLDADAREELRKVALAGLPAAPFVVTARAWAARGVAPGEP
jgi:hypothetical protein